MSETLTNTDTASTDLAPEETIAVGAGNEPEAEPNPEEPSAPKTRREAIAAAADKVTKEDSEEESDVEKPDPQSKPENVKPKPDAEEATEAGKEEAAEKPEKEPGEEGEDKAQKDGEKKQPPAPKRFLPKAKETWANTPNSVKAEVVRLERDYDELSQRSSENEKYRENLKVFEDFTSKHGVPLQDALKLYTDIDRLLSQNPVQAVADILGRIGMKPEQYAQMVMQNSPQYQAQMLVPRQQAQPQQPQVSPREQELQQQLAREQAARVNAEVIAPFAAAHPRFQELQETVVQFLNSGMIPNNLAPAARLEAAYDMAERLAPRSVPTAQEAPATQANAQTANPRAGKLQIKGAPSSGNTKSPVARGKMSRKAAIEAAMERAGA
ncbi:hypothetical protein AD952_05670 [Acetobacter cerevisiae]|uniref:Uncharacterized protein n=1 Tax=Acetobacter cerevisiae TaxID=178900 RepID=A0A149UW69_9PROT|nr:hypothetical protein [Acetobacter cerevisiae]KXV72200.1 hypothetical protein AD952_05670 [Acetobacter cerevisiae]